MTSKEWLALKPGDIVWAIHRGSENGPGDIVLEVVTSPRNIDVPTEFKVLKNIHDYKNFFVGSPWFGSGVAIEDYTFPPAPPREETKRKPRFDNIDED